MHYGKECTSNEGKSKDEVRGKRGMEKDDIDGWGGKRWIGERLRWEAVMK